MSPWTWNGTSSRMRTSRDCRYCGQFTIGTARSSGSSTRPGTMSAFTGSTIKARRCATGYWDAGTTSTSIPSSRILGSSLTRRPKIDFEATDRRCTSRSRGSPGGGACSSRNCLPAWSVPTSTSVYPSTRYATSACERSNGGCATTVRLAPSRYPGVCSSSFRICIRVSPTRLIGSSSNRNRKNSRPSVPVGSL